MQHTGDVSTEDVFSQSHNYEERSPGRVTVQAPGPGIADTIWGSFRELPKPLAWSEADSRGHYLSQDSTEWERLWSNAGLNSFLPDEEDSPLDDRPHPLWPFQDASALYNTTSFQMYGKVSPFPVSVSVPEYVYTPLPNKDEIRILDLLPGQGIEPLAFNLRVGHIHDHATKYEALSYVWGTAMVDIVCQGKRFSIPHNLYCALVGIRNSTKVRSVWADSICINQKNDQEKNHQVRMMRKIFRQAQRVLIWLDVRDAHVAQVAFKLAGRIHQGQLQDIPPPQSPVWDLFIRLFDNDWFSRLWCLQEVVLASSALVIWGTETAPWEHIGFSAGWLCNIGYETLSFWIAKVGRSRLRLTESFRSHHSRSHYHPGVYRASLMYSLWSAINRETGLAKPIYFYDLLCETRLFEAKDPRDKVFGLVGIPTADADPEGSQCFVEPDYSKTTEEVFVDVAKRILAGKPDSLHLLGAVQHQPRGCKSTESLPTWVPNWTLFRSRSLVPSTVYEHGLLPASKPVRTEGSTLLVSGVIIDTVTYAESLTSRDDLARMIFCLSRAWQNISKLFDVYHGDSDMRKAFCFTITAGNNWLGQRVMDTDRGQHLADYEAFRKQYCAEGYGFPILKTPQGVAQPVQPDARRYYEALCHACSNRNIFVTKKGYMGLGPGAMEPGAEIALLGGAKLPMILTRCRPQSTGSKLHGYSMLDTHDNPASSESIKDPLAMKGEGPAPGSSVFPEPNFNVVGESYVYGIMDGQIEINASDCEDIQLM